MLSRTISNLSQIIVQIVDENRPLCVFSLTLGVIRTNVHCSS